MDSILNYIGGKSGSCKKIVELMPSHFCYVETNFGGGWVFFAKPRTKVEVINDINGELMNFWKVIQRQPNEFLERSKYEMYSRELYTEYCNDVKSGKYLKMSNVERAFRTFCMYKCSFGSKFLSGWGYGRSRNQGDAFFNEFKIIDEIAERLKHVQIDNKDFQSVIEDYDGDDTLYFCDPPYIGADVDAQYFKATSGSFTLQDHQRLYKTLLKLKGKFILTIDNVDWIRDRYCQGKQGEHGLWWIENTVFYSSADKDNREHVTELIITNYDTNEVIKQNKLLSIKDEEKKSMKNTKSLMDFS